jgi:hypothetical protein
MQKKLALQRQLLFCSKLPAERNLDRESEAIQDF